MHGRYVPSLLAAIGDVIAQHMVDIGLLPGSGRPDQAGEQRKIVNLTDQRLRQCPKCGQAALVRQEGCDSCTSCDYSKCG
jgi:ribonucleoside-diphosphate reductase alpha chain